MRRGVTTKPIVLQGRDKERSAAQHGQERMMENRDAVERGANDGFFSFFFFFFSFSFFFCFRILADAGRRIKPLSRGQKREEALGRCWRVQAAFHRRIHCNAHMRLFGNKAE